MYLGIDTLINKIENFLKAKDEHINKNKHWPLFIKDEDSTLGTILEETKCYTYIQEDDGINVNQIFEFSDENGGDGLKQLINQLFDMYQS